MSTLILPAPAPRPRRDRPFGGSVLTPTPRGTGCAGLRGDRDRPEDNRPPPRPKQPSPPNPRDPDKLPDPKDGSR